MNKAVVKGGSFSSEFKRFSDDLVFIHRDHQWSKNLHQIDAFGEHWWMFVKKSLDYEVEVFTENQWRGGDQYTAMFCPPFSVVEWRLTPGLFEWEAYISSSPIPNELHECPQVMRWNDGVEFKSASELLDIVTRTPDKLKVRRQPTFSAVTSKTKQHIDRCFNESHSMQEIADQVGFHMKVMARYFKSEVGLSPSEYRRKLRIMDAKCNMLFNNVSVLDAAIASGFSTPGGFNKAFHKVLALAPSSIPDLDDN